ncbi:MAG: hypothetical protein L0I24_05465 [Pseudonocardia sp.]|nr:hypothetical protein [Pseudonocardia sp.]
MAGDRSALLGLLLYLVIAVAPTLVLWFALRVLPAAVSAVVERRRAPPQAPSLEQVVADLRRLRREIRGAPQRTRVRQVALVSAYDDVLLQVCDVVGVDEPPLATATGGDRAFARLLTEAAVEQAGISLDPPHGGSAAA